MAEPLSHEGLAAQYRAAWDQYRRRWAHIDEVLYAAFQAHPGTSWPDVHTKVVLVDGVYRAGLSRVLGVDASEKATRALREAEPRLEPAVEMVRTYPTLGLEAASAAVGAHAVVLQALAPLVWATTYLTQ